MLLKSLEIKGFKSFPDKTVLSFGRGITAVVGPNGSGKSNLSDAIRWVLGEQSNKALRGSRMEDVIFSGTQTRSSVGYAEVSLTVDNRSRRLDFDADEVRVTRRYYRSGESEYLLNNATVRLKDVQMLFMDTGLGRDGYSIIGQGRIEDIVASRSEDRREIFEEAAGISKYRYRKNDAERRLQAAEDNLLRLQDILRELEERVGPLEVQSKKARKFLEYAEEKKGLEIGLWLDTIRRSRETLRTLSSQLELARTQYDAAGDAIDKIEEQIDAVGLQAAGLSAQMDEQRRLAAELDEEAVRHESDVAVRRNDIAHNEENMTRIRGDLEQIDAGDKQLEEELAARQADAETRRAQIAEAEKEQLSLSEKMDTLSKSSDEAGDRMEEQNRVAADLARRLSDARVQEVTGESSLAEITLQLSQLDAAMVLRTQQSEEAEKQRAECEQACTACREQIASLQNTVDGYELRYQTRAGKMQKAREDADKYKLDTEETRRRLSILEELERSMEGFSGSVKLIVKQGERGMLRGILGPISRLIETPADVALAIETALGNAAQNIVCETEADAKRGINYLKNEKAGRVTFLPLDTVRGDFLNEKGLSDQDGFVGVASELVSYDARFKPAVQNLLGRIAVAEDLDAAAAIGRKYGHHFRIVTLDGQVVNAGGSMTGGSHVKGAGLLSRRTEIERLQEKLAVIRGKADAANAALQQIGQEAAAAQAALTGAKGELATAQEDGIRLEGELKRLTELAESGKSAAADCAREIEALHARVEEIKQSVEQAKAAIAELTEKQTSVEAALTELSGGRAEITAAREALSAQMAEVKLRAVGYQKEVEALEAAMTALTQRRQDGGGARKLLEGQLAELEAKNAEIEQTIGDLQAHAADCRARAGQAREQAEALVKQRTESEAGITALRKEERERADEKERLGGEVVRLEEKAVHAEQETDEIVAKLYEEYELTRAEAEEVAAPIEDVKEASRRLAELRGKIRALGNVNVEAIEEYKEVRERYDFLSVQVKDVETSRAELLNLIADLTTQMREAFIERFHQINAQFGTVFAELFGGGKAALRLDTPDDILHSGIEMDIQPPGKVIRNLDALSGGEKALVAIALLFAILKVTPSPFCVLDEIEAALDDINVGRFAAFLRRMTEDTQFIVITHRRGTMEEADVLYGVTMQEYGVTKLLELRASEVEARLGLKLGEQN